MKSKIIPPVPDRWVRLNYGPTDMLGIKSNSKRSPIRPPLKDKAIDSARNAVCQTPTLDAALSKAIAETADEDTAEAAREGD